jgi:hypothetical protein
MLQIKKDGGMPMVIRISVGELPGNGSQSEPLDCWRAVDLIDPVEVPVVMHHGQVTDDGERGDHDIR